MPRIIFFFTRLLYVAKRKAYAIRLLIPGLRRLHKLEIIVGPRGFWHQSRAYQIEALKRNGLNPPHRLLDFGCGPMQGGVAIIKYLNEGNYVGLDNTPLNLNAAYSELAHHNLAVKKPTLILSDDFRKVSFGKTRFDFIWASQILCYFSEEMLIDLFGYASTILNHNGKLLFDIVGECPIEFRTSNHIKWMQSVHLHTVEAIMALAVPFGFEVRSLGKIEDFGYPRGLNLRDNELLELTKIESRIEGPYRPSKQINGKAPQPREEYGSNVNLSN